MPRIKASEDLRPISDLKSHGAEIVRQTTESGRPVILTKHGRGVAVVLSLVAYEVLQEAVDEPPTLTVAEEQGLIDALAAARDGKSISHAELSERVGRVLGS